MVAIFSCYGLCIICEMGPTNNQPIQYDDVMMYHDTKTHKQYLAAYTLYMYVIVISFLLVPFLRNSNHKNTIYILKPLFSGIFRIFGRSLLAQFIYPINFRNYRPHTESTNLLKRFNGQSVTQLRELLPQREFRNCLLRNDQTRPTKLSIQTLGRYQTELSACSPVLTSAVSLSRSRGR